MTTAGSTASVTYTPNYGFNGAESFNGRLRDECLNINWFMSIKHAHAREVIESWRQDYNEVRPHSSLKGRSPKEYAEAVAALY